MTADPTATSLAELDPESRALLELSMVRGLSDGDLAGMLGSETDRMRERREGVLRSLGVQSQAEVDGLAAALRGEEQEPEQEPEHQDPPGDEPSPGRGPRRLVWALVGGLMIAAVVALALALGSNEDGGEGAGPAAPEEPQPEPGRAPPAGAPPAELTPLGEGAGRATAQIVVAGEGPRLRLAVRGLPRVARGGYVVWLYNSISQAQELTGSRSGTFSASPPLPREAARYRFVDVSREPADGNRNHSGASVLRIAIEKVPRTSR